MWRLTYALWSGIPLSSLAHKYRLRLQAPPAFDALGYLYRAARNGATLLHIAWICAFLRMCDATS